MTSFKYSKNDLVFYYKNSNFPENLIHPDSLILKEILFSEKSETPEACKIIHKKIKFSSSFLIDTNQQETVKPKFRSVSRTKPNYENNNNNCNNIYFKKSIDETENKYKNPSINSSNNLDISQAKNKNNDYLLCRENSISIVNLIFNENHINQKTLDLNNNLSYLLNQGSNKKSNENNDRVIIKGRKFSETTSIIPNIPKPSIPNTYNDNSINSYKPISNLNINDFDVKNIFKINEFLNYPKEEPLWYIYQPLTKSSVGPCSSELIENMLKENILNLNSDIRFIDVFNHSKKTPFNFFKLLDFNNPNFIDDLEISVLVQNSLKPNKNYRINFNFDAKNDFEKFEMIKKITDSEVNTPVKELNNSNKTFFSNLKQNPVTLTPKIADNSNISNTPTNFFNKSNKIQKGINLISNVKTETKLTALDPTKINKGQISPRKEVTLKNLLDTSQNITNNKETKEVIKQSDNTYNNSSSYNNNFKNENLNKDYNRKSSTDNYNRKNNEDTRGKYEQQNYDKSYNYDKNYNYNNNYYYENNKPYPRKNSKNKRGSLPPKKNGFTYDKYDFNGDNQKVNYDGNYDNNYSNNYYNKNYNNNKNYK